MIQKCSISRVAGVFFDDPQKEFDLKEVSNKSNLAHTSVKNHLKALQKQHIITLKAVKKGQRTFTFFQANTTSETYRREKILHNVNSIYASGLIEYLIDNLMPTAIIVFGSYAKAEDMLTSDIDIYVDVQKQEINLQKFKKKLNRDIELHMNANVSSYPKELRNNIANGIKLYGYLVYIP